MKILTLSNLYPPNAVGGYEQLCFDVMHALAERGDQIVVLTSHYGGRQAEYSNQKVLPQLELLAEKDNIYAQFSASAIERERINKHNIDTLKQTLMTEKPDVVFVWNLHFLDPSFLAALETAEVQPVYLLTDNWLVAFHNPHFIATYFAEQVHAVQGGWQRFIKTRFQRLLSLRQQHQEMSGSAIFASSFMVDLYRQAGLSFARQVVIHHGIVPAEIQLVPLDRSQLLHRQELHLLFAGRIVDIKGVHTAIAALPLVIQAFPQLRVQLKIVGDDRDQPYREKLREQLETLGIEAQVSFVPPVAEAELPQLFQHSDIYLFPSLYEPFSLTLIHALRSGIPTVASRAGGTPEIVLHRQTGMLFDTADSADLARQTIALAKTPQLRAELSRRACDVANQFTFKRMVDKVSDHLSAVYQG
ncbi:MAG: glycosyltransferase family 4 protein [Thermodesulfobacteriota bacterium]|nr:glycosyltransferase family 4 protein [Thermodesulfobacteriota bacterium]